MLYNIIGRVFVYTVFLIIGLLTMRTLLELFRRWFVRVQYPCNVCGSRFTTFKRKWFDISTGTLYATKCLACHKHSDFRYSYYRGLGKHCGEPWYTSLVVSR